MVALSALRNSLWLALALLLAMVLSLAGIVTVQADGPGDLDTGFGSGGLITETVGLSGFALALQSDGRIVVAGPGGEASGGYYTLARFTPGGSLDSGFGSGGVVTDSRITQAWDAVLQPDDKIIVAGVSKDSSARPLFGVARYTRDGYSDLNFGSGGVVTTPIDLSSWAWDVVLQPDGKIVVTGSSRGQTAPESFALVRYTSAGALDLNFGQGGVVTTPIDARAVGYAAVVQADGKIVVAGTVSNDPFSTNDNPYCAGNTCSALARYTENGLLDPGFGNGGIVTTVIGLKTDGYNLALQPDGKLLMAGVGYYEGYTTFAVARYTPVGVLDTGFGHDGVITTVIGSAAGANALTLQSDGRILVAGTTTTAGSKALFALARYTRWGSLDPSFGHQGIVTTPIQINANADSVLVQPDDKILVAGDTSGGSLSLALVRYIGGGARWQYHLPVIQKGGQ